ncbi:hypothetical protein Tco_0779996 [Tanacetum coccineum]
MLTERGDGVTSIKRRRHDLRSDGVSTLAASSEHGRPKGTLEDSNEKVDETTKRALLYTWIEVGNEERLMNDVVSSDEGWEEHEYGDPLNIVADSSKPYLDTHHKRDGSNNDKWNENTSELGKAPHPNKVSDARRTCKTEKFEVIKYSLGPNEEYIAI